MCQAIFCLDKKEKWAIILYMPRKNKKTGTSMNGITNPRREKAQNAQYGVSNKEKQEWKKLYGWSPPSSRMKRKRRRRKQGLICPQVISAKPTTDLSAENWYTSPAVNSLGHICSGMSGLVDSLTFHIIVILESVEKPWLQAHILSIIRYGKSVLFSFFATKLPGGEYRFTIQVQIIIYTLPPIAEGYRLLLCGLYLHSYSTCYCSSVFSLLSQWQGTHFFSNQFFS